MKMKHKIYKILNHLCFNKRIIIDNQDINGLSYISIDSEELSYSLTENIKIINEKSNEIYVIPKILSGTRYKFRIYPGNRIYDLVIISIHDKKYLLNPKNKYDFSEKNISLMNNSILCDHIPIKILDREKYRKELVKVLLGTFFNRYYKMEDNIKHKIIDIMIKKICETPSIINLN